MRLKTVKERLEQFSIPEPMSGCWLWLACTNGKVGYGLISVGSRNGKRTQLYAHRVSYEFYCGEIPEGLQVLHSCDNSYCINPDHLYLGTHQDNMRDIQTRDRAKGKHHQEGEKHPSAVLTTEKVLAIRASADPARVLANRYGTSISAIRHVKTRRSWSHI